MKCQFCGNIIAGGFVEFVNGKASCGCVSGQLKSSGNKDTFSSGAVRDSIEGKPLMELLPLDLLMRVSIWYGLGAKKYGDNNWRKGQPIKRCVGSILRHLTKYIMGQRDEDHLSAIVFNALSIMNVEMYHADDPQLNDLNYTDQINGARNENDQV